MDGFLRELGVTEDEALNLIGRSVTIAKTSQRTVHSKEGM